MNVKLQLIEQCFARTRISSRLARGWVKWLGKTRHVERAGIFREKRDPKRVPGPRAYQAVTPGALDAAGVFARTEVNAAMGFLLAHVV